MHNQYEWQHMLPEALAIVCRCRNPIVLLVTLFKPFMCSIKFDKTGFLSLTEAGLQEIGRCDQVSQSFIWSKQTISNLPTSASSHFEPTESLPRWTSTRTARSRLSLRKRRTWRWIPGAGSRSRTSDRERVFHHWNNDILWRGQMLLLLSLWLQNALCHSIYRINTLPLKDYIMLLPLLNHHHSISERWLPLALLWPSLWRSTPQRHPGNCLELMLDIPLN